MELADALGRPDLTPENIEMIRGDVEPVLLADVDEMIARRAAKDAHAAFMLGDYADSDFTELIDADNAADNAWRAAEKHAHEIRYLRNDPLAKKTVAIEAAVELPAIAEPLPPYPASLAQAKVDFTTGDENDVMYVTFNVGTGDDAVGVTIWKDADGDARNSIDDGGEETPWGDDTEDEFLVWGNAVRSRIELDQYFVAQAAMAAAETSILTRATA